MQATQLVIVRQRWRGVKVRGASAVETTLAIFGFDRYLVDLGGENKVVFA